MIVKKIFKIVFSVIGSIIGVFVLLIGGLNILKFAIYSDFYKNSKDIGGIPGLNDNAIPQGICYDELNEVYYISSYTKNKTASRIYVTDGKNSFYKTLEKDGKDFKGHVGGIATTGEYAYIANGSKIYKVKTESINDKSTKVLKLNEEISVNNAASFVFTNDTDLYVGEFHDGGKYVTNHPIKVDEKTTHYAIISKYSLSDLSKPTAIYSVRNKVQGMCVKDNGEIVLSTSYGLSSSYFYTYLPGDFKESDEEIDGIKVTILDKVNKKMKAPAMMEDLDFVDGKVVSLTESACDKYIFGKFFFAWDFFSINL